MSSFIIDPKGRPKWASLLVVLAALAAIGVASLYIFSQSSSSAISS